MCICVSMYLCVMHTSVGVPRGQKMALDPLVLGLWRLWAPGVGAGSQAQVLLRAAISPALCIFNDKSIILAYQFFNMSLVIFL